MHADRDQGTSNHLSGHQDARRISALPWRVKLVGDERFLRQNRRAYRSGHLTRPEWLIRAWLHSRIIEATGKTDEAAVIRELERLVEKPKPVQLSLLDEPTED